MKKKKGQIIVGITLAVITVIADVLSMSVFGSSIDKGLVTARSADEEEIQSVRKNALETAQEIEEEGIVLLKNNGTLPLAEDGNRINLLGYRAYNPIYGGTGSGGSSYTEERVPLVQALEEAGFELNPDVKKAYESVSKKEKNTFKVDFSIREYGAEEELCQKIGQTYLFSEDASFEKMKQYSDTAVIVFGRGGGEDNDFPMSMEAYTDYESDKEKHYLELNSAELSVLQKAEECFAHVIVLINSSNAMELGFLEDEKIDSALWIGGPGDVGSKAVAEILKGEVNPSGRTADIYPYEVESIPSYYNFGEYAYTNSAQCFSRKKNEPQTAFLVNYQEGIYVGYRYYETRKQYSYETREGKKIKDAAYEEVVQYPFGYGLSYTTFSWEAEELPVKEISDPESEIRVKVKVTNTGNIAGKDVVQLYYSAPYYPENKGSGIQKAEVVLGDYQKTGILLPGESEIVELSIKAENLASYDEKGYYSENGSYVLEAGEYKISLRTDSHTVKKEYSFKIPETVVYAETGNDESAVYAGKRSSDLIVAENLFTGAAGQVDYMKRETWNIVQGTDQEATEEQLESFRNAKKLPEEYEADGVDTAETVTDTVTADHRLALKELAGKAYDDPMWEDLLNQLSWNDMEEMLGANGWGTSPINSISKPQIYDMDGPAAISYILDVFMHHVTYKTITYPTEVVLASTWNQELADAFGNAISMEGKAQGVSGWYAPGVNIHRNPFAGRNFEYYSEDPLLSGTMAAAVVRGASKNGMYCYIKHFAMNEMETNRHYGICSWACEQSIREIYLKAFEIPVKTGKATAIMSSYNNIGTTWAGACKQLLTNVLREEWGFKGTVLTDNYEDHGFMDLEKSITAGGTALLCSMGVQNLAQLKKTQIGRNAIREAVHQYLYTISNSTAVMAKCEMPVWRKVALIFSAFMYLLSAWLIIKGLRKRGRKEQ